MRGFEPDGIGPRECLNKQCNNSNDDALEANDLVLFDLRQNFL